MKPLLTIILVSTIHLSIAQTTQQDTTLSDSLGSVTETVFGKVIHDPFRGLEDKDDPAVQAWMQAKNEEAVESLQNIPGYEALKQEMKMYSNAANVRSSVPIENNGRIYSLQTLMESQVNQIAMLNSPFSEAEVIFSTATLNEQDSTFYTIYSFEPSPDNRYLAIQLYPDGNDEMEIRILDVEKKQLLDEVINASVSYFPSWLPSSRAFFYTQLSLPEDSTELYDKVRVRQHVLGESQSEDKIMLEPSDSSSIAYQAGDFPVFHVLTGGKHVLCSVSRGISQYASYHVIPLSALMQPKKESAWTTLFDLSDQVSDAVSDGQAVYSLHHRENPNGIIRETSLEKPDVSETVFSPSEGYIKAFKLAQEALYVEHIIAGLSHLIRIKDNQEQDLPLPFLGDIDLNAEGFLSSVAETGLFFGLSNWTHGYGIYYYDAKKDTVSRTSVRPAGAYDLPDHLMVSEVQVTSHDGEKVPLSIIHDKEVTLNGDNPTILEAYGAYGESLEPYFSAEMLSWYKRGGVIACAHVRGGSEKGMAWHDAGKKAHKPNTWKDLIACAEYLIEKGYTRSEKLGARGGSAGGIAVGRAITERPELFGAAVLEYPLVNPTRLDQTQSAIVQQDEFGSPSDSVEFQYLYEMDTYLHVWKGEQYPAVLLTAGEEDYRIPAWEPAKLAARMARDRGNERVTLFRLYQGGHGTGDAEESLAYDTDPIAFFLWQLGHAEYQDRP